MASVSFADKDGPDRGELRVFVSSTFRDMQPEREELLKRVGPRLRQLCGQRDVAFSFIDLRWGITEEESRTGKVASLCLAEIDNCAPYFVGLLGDRYGWVPDKLPPDLVTQQPWVRDYTGRSVTELEIAAGALRKPTVGCAFFYFREPGVAEPDHRLLALKERIRGSGLDVREYARADQLGEQVLADLTKLIDRLYPPNEETSASEREDCTQRAYANSVIRMHIVRQSSFERLDEHAEGDGLPLMLTGDTGSGKTALLAAWAHRRREQHPDQLFVEHYVGASPDSTNWEQMLLRIMTALKRHFNIAHDLPTEIGGLRSGFADFLNMATAQGRWVLLVDGLDKLEDRDNALDLLWLPDAMLQPSLRVVLSSLPGRPLDAAQARKWLTMQIEGLDHAERERFIHEYLALYRKRLDPPRVARIAGAQQTANPSFLQTLLEELRLFGEHERLDERIGYYLDAKVLKDLSDRILDRYEQDYEAGHPGLVRHVMTAIWASRLGLYESELLDLAGSGDEPLAQATWSAFRAGTEASLMVRSGFLGFRQAAFGQAVEQRYVPTPELKQRAHREIADDFEGKPLSRRKATELPWQRKQAGQFERLADVLGELKFLAESVSTRTFDACELWNDIERNTGRSRVQAYADVIDHPEAHLDSIEDVALLLLNGDAYEPATRMLSAAERHCEAAGLLDLQANYLWDLYKIRRRSITRMEFRRVIRPAEMLDRQVAVLRKVNAPERLVTSLSELAGETLDDAGTIPDDEVKRELVLKARGYFQEAERVARDAGLWREVAIALAKQAVTYTWLSDWHAGGHLHDLAFRRAVVSLDKKAILFAAWQRADFYGGAYGGAVLPKQEFKRLLTLCIELSRQVDTASDYAGKIKSLAMTLLQVATDQADYDEVMEWRGEARRMMKITGDTDPWLGEAGEAMIQAAARAKVYMPDVLGSHLRFEGPRRKWWAVSDEWLSNCRDHTEESLSDLSAGKCIDSFEMEFYDALNYLVNPIRRADPAQRATLVAEVRRDAGDEGTSEALEQTRFIQALTGALNGGDELFLGYSYGHSESSFVQYVAQWLKVVFVPTWNDLTSRVTSRMLDDDGIYPGGWEEWGEEGRAHLRQKFDELSEFYGRAAKAGACVVVGPSGVELDLILEPWRERLRIERETPSDWFQATGREDWTEIHGACRYCGEEFWYDLYLDKRPPPRCLKCGK